MTFLDGCAAPYPARGSSVSRRANPRTKPGAGYGAAGQYRNEKGAVIDLQSQSTSTFYLAINERKAMQIPALSTRTVGEAELLMDTFMEIVSDGVITPMEISATSKLIRNVYSSALETDLAQAAGIAVMRTGTDGKRAKELMGQLVAS